jgi:site-specific recombinase XerC
VSEMIELCGRAGAELCSLGELGPAILVVVDAAQATANGRGVEALSDPAFALEVLTATDRCDAAAVGRVLDFLRTRAGSAPVAADRTVTVAEAVAAYEAGALALMAKGTGHTYRTWTRRLIQQARDTDIGELSAGDLTDVIARYANVERDGRRGRGRAAEENAIAAFRHLWGYLVEKGYARANLAARLRKPSRGEPSRRAIRADEAALLRRLAQSGRDALLDEVTLSLAERLGLRRIEMCRFRLRDIELRHAEAKVWGKGDKDRIMPIPPQLARLLECYIDDRRPAAQHSAQWARSDDVLLRRRPSAGHPVPTGRRRIEELFDDVGLLLGFELGLLAEEPAFGNLHPARVRSRARWASNSAIIARTLNSTRPTGSVGSCTVPPMLRLTPRLERSATIARRSDRERASRSSFGDPEGSPSRRAAIASRWPGRRWLVPVSPWST